MFVDARNAALRNDVVRVAPAEAGALEHVHDLLLRRVLAIETVLVLLLPDGPPQDHLLGAGGEALIAVVEDDFHICGHDRGAGAFVEEGGALFAGELGVVVAEDEADGGEEVGLCRCHCGRR